MSRLIPRSDEGIGMKVHPSAVRPQIRVFICPVCGARTTAPKTYGRTHPGHIKTFWCWRCKCDTDQIQLE